ncbi:HlyC/CorC family transporter [Skermanella sp. TT6]|uniref:HlyC/CorC family transporter n=1 Tax=Skermanella cutis TaxID=2775420 RepID=A0ABX7BCX5_9PROT|nr:hemolysin family protein [Skermanella sp. TT6]QQP91098.1 HlyC/CorC family transporter [Skermanella sp. TT6]
MFAWELTVVVLLIVLNGFFAMSELAVVSARRARLQQMAEAGDRGARAAMRLVEDPSKFLSTVQVGITLIGILAGAYGGATLAGYLAVELRGIPAIQPYADGVSFAVVVVLITYLSLIIGELVPKRIALVNAERIAAVVSRPMGLIAALGAPLVWVLGVSTNLVLRLLRLNQVKQAEVTEEEVKSMIAEGARTGVFDPAEREMIEGVLRLADRSVRTIMTPRPDVHWLDLADGAEAIRREIAESGRSRFPVSRGDLDEIVGIVKTKDLLDQLLTGRPLDLQSCIEKPLIIHDGTKVLRVLELFKQTGQHMAIVVDEYGSVEGIATAADILETIAGDFPEAGEDEAGLVRREDGTWLVDGMLPIDEAEHRLGLRGLRGDRDFHTLAGFVMAELGHVPSAGEHFSWRGSRFEVVDMDGRRVDKVLVTTRPADKEDDGPSI